MPPIYTNPAIVTPPASEVVQTGPISPAANPNDALPFKWREESAQSDHHTIFRTFLQYQGQEVQLGDDSGTAQVWSASPQYLAWSFEHVDLSQLYVRVVATGKDIQIAPGQWWAGLARVAGDWVAYINSSSPTMAPPPTRYDAPRGTYRLIAYSLLTGQTVTLTAGIPEIRGRSQMYFFGLSGNRAGWIEYDIQKQIFAMKLEDLGTGAVQTINIPLQKPLFFSLSKNLLVWRDTYWHGYSLDRNAAFTIPNAPKKEWENNGVTVVARDSAVEWDVLVGDNYQYYTAPVINK